MNRPAHLGDSLETARPGIRLERVEGPRPATIEQRVRDGLTKEAKSLPPVLFYDARGSALFDRICELEEYYPTRTERALIAGHVKQVSEHCGPELTVAELGSGSSEKSTLILEALLSSGRSVRYVPIEVSDTALLAAADRLSRRFAALDLAALCGEYEPGLDHLPRLVQGQCLVLFLGSSLGNYEPAAADRLLSRIRRALSPGDLLLMGLDLVKERETLERAYDDAEGVTAEFNLNVLRRLNEELGANFDLDRFRHKACWNETRSRVEMHLESTVEQRVRITGADLELHFRENETIHTESSYKYRREDIASLGARAGFSLVEHWTDPRRWFSLNLFAAGASGA